MGKYIAQRMLQAIPMLVGISFLAFVLLRLAPGGPVAIYAQNPTMGEADLRRIEHSLGLDQPIPIQYLKCICSGLGGIVRQMTSMPRDDAHR